MWLPGSWTPISSTSSFSLATPTPPLALSHSGPLSWSFLSALCSWELPHTPVLTQKGFLPFHWCSQWRDTSLGHFSFWRQLLPQPLRISVFQFEWAAMTHNRLCSSWSSCLWECYFHEWPGTESELPRESKNSSRWTGAAVELPPVWTCWMACNINKYNHWGSMDFLELTLTMT